MTPSSRKALSLSAAVAAMLIANVAGPRGHAASADGMVIQISDTPNLTGLFGQVYSLQQPNVAGAEAGISATAGASPNFNAIGFAIVQSIMNQAPVNASGYSNVNFNAFNATAPFSAYGSALTDNITARWSGSIDLPAGVSTFATNSDDGSVIYIDGVRVVNNNQFQGNVRRIGQTANFATAGSHEIVIAYYEGTGNAGVEARYAPGVATTNVNDAAFTIIPVLDGSNNQVLRGVTAALTPADGAVTFSIAGSTGGVNFANTLQATMATLTFAGNNTLNYKGAATRFTSTTFNGGGTNVIAVSTDSAFSQDIALGLLNDGGTAVRLQKTGPGQLVLDQSAVANTMSSNSVVEIRGGGIVLSGRNDEQSPIGAATIELGSTLPATIPIGVTVLPSTLSLSSKSGNVTFDVPVSVTSSNTIIAQPATVTGNLTAFPGAAVGVPNPPAVATGVTVTLGGTKGVGVAAGQTATLQSSNGYSLSIGGGVSGAGNVAFASGTILVNSSLTNTGTIGFSGAGSFVTYNINNAFNNRMLNITGGVQVQIGAGVTSTGGDSFSVANGNVLSVPNATVAAILTRGGNLLPATGAILAESAASAASAIQNLGTNSDLFLGLSANLSETVTVGSIPGATPWRGISTDRSARTLANGTTLTAPSNFQFSNANNANLTTQAITIVTPNGPIVTSVSMGTGRLLPASNASGLNSNITFTLNGGVIQLTADRALGGSAIASENARIVAYPGTTVDPNGIANTMSGNVFLLSGSFLQLNDANNLGGTGVITGESGAIVQLQNATALGNANAVQTPATLPAGVLYRLEQDLGASLAANTNPAGNFQVQGASRTNSVVLSAGTPTRSGYVSGMLSNDNAARTLNAAGAVTIGAGGATFASPTGQTFTIAAPVTVSTGGGRSLTVGTTRIVDSAISGDIRNGTVSLSSTANNWGTGTDALAQLSLVGRANVQNAVAAGAGTSALPQGTGLAVNLGGTYQINGGSGAGTSTVQLGQLTPQGGTIFLNRNTTTPDALVVSLNAAISRSNTFGPGARGTVTFLTTAGQTLGTNDKVVFANAANAPARINGSSGPINMVPPWLIGTDVLTNVAVSTFLDVDPATATTTGFKPVTYVAMPLTGGTGGEIADNTAAATLAGPITVAALRTNANITGQTIDLTTGGLLFRGSAAVVTISSGINFGANEGIITNISGQANNITGALSGTGGLSKHGSNSVALGNASSTLTGGITINEFNLRPGVANGIPQNNIVTVNAAGVLDLNNFDQAVQGVQGNGVIQNNVAGTRTLTLTSPNAGDSVDFTGTIRNANGTIALTKSGPGTQVLSGTLGYTGATNVNGGTLLVNGLSTGASSYTIGAGGTLGGAGIITGAVSADASGTLAPGGTTAATAVGAIRTGALTLQADSNFSVDLNGATVGTGLPSNSGYDQADVVGAVSLNGGNLQLALNYIPTLGDKLFIVNNDQIDAIVGTFGKLNGAAATLTEGSTFNLTSKANNQSYQFRISYLGEYYANNVNVGNDVVLIAVPEPSTFGLISTAAIGLLVPRRRRGCDNRITRMN